MDNAWISPPSPTGGQYCTPIGGHYWAPVDTERMKSGAPTVAALEAALGHDLTSHERDAAWAAYSDAIRGDAP